MKLTYPITIVIGAIILGGSFLTVQILKQNSIERQEQAKISYQREIDYKKEAKELDQKLQLDYCISDAENSYWSYMKLNGTVKPNGDITAPNYVWDIAKADKQTAINNCYKK